MRKKTLQFLMGISMSAMLIGGAVPAMAEEEMQLVEQAVEEVAPDAAEAPAEEVAEQETQATAEQVLVEAQQTEAAAQVETETEASDFIEGSALLSDYDYEFGKLTEEGWESSFLDMKFTPAKEMKMDLEDNEKLKEYHVRNGEDKQISCNEMVAKDDKSGYVQLMVEVNPNNESAEDILARFAEIEGLELVSKTKDIEIAGKNFKTCTGIKDKERYMIGATSDVENLAVAIKVKYKNSDARDEFLGCFDTLTVKEEETEVETEAVSEVEETETEAVSEAEEKGLKINRKPKNFEAAEMITEAESEPLSE